MMRLLWVSLGGALGTGARYLLGNWVLRALGPSFPFHTLAVNALGSFLLGALMHVGVTTTVLSPTLRITLSTGLLGGFTTYSSFNYETLVYCQQGSWALAFLNVAATLLGCLAAGLLGFGLARMIVGH